MEGMHMAMLKLRETRPAGTATVRCMDFSSGPVRRRDREECAAAARRRLEIYTEIRIRAVTG